MFLNKEKRHKKIETQQDFIQALITCIQQGQKVTLLTDSDGTQVPFSAKRNEVVPDPVVIANLPKLRQMGINIVVITGRTVDSIDATYHKLDDKLNVIGEHGISMRIAGSEDKVLYAEFSPQDPRYEIHKTYIDDAKKKAQKFITKIIAKYGLEKYGIKVDDLLETEKTWGVGLHWRAISELADKAEYSADREVIKQNVIDIEQEYKIFLQELTAAEKTPTVGIDGGETIPLFGCYLGDCIYELKPNEKLVNKGNAGKKLLQRSEYADSVMLGWFGDSFISVDSKNGTLKPGTDIHLAATVNQHGKTHPSCRTVVIQVKNTKPAHADINIPADAAKVLRDGVPNFTVDSPATLGQLYAGIVAGYEKALEAEKTQQSDLNTVMSHDRTSTLS